MLLGKILPWKKGVLANDSFAQYALDMESRHEGWWPFSYAMLEEIQGQYIPQDEALLQRLYQSMRAGDGIYKITRRDRFGELDDWLERRLSLAAERPASTRIHDMGASNAITSLALFRKLSHLPEVRVHASDFFDRIWLVRPTDTRWVVVYDREGRPLQYVGHRMVLSAYRPEPKRYLINKIVQLRLARVVLPKANKALMAGGFALSGPELGRSSEVREISLFHPLAEQEAKHEPRFSLGWDSVFEPSGNKVDVLRVMNLLTDRHMTLGDISRAVGTLRNRLAEGGLFIQGRNIDEIDGKLCATVFQYLNGNLIPIEDFGGGSELRRFIAGLDTNALGDSLGGG